MSEFSNAGPAKVRNSLQLNVLRARVFCLAGERQPMIYPSLSRKDPGHASGGALGSEAGWSGEPAGSGGPAGRCPSRRRQPGRGAGGRGHFRSARNRWPSMPRRRGFPCRRPSARSSPRPAANRTWCSALPTIRPASTFGRRPCSRPRWSAALEGLDPFSEEYDADHRRPDGRGATTPRVDADGRVVLPRALLADVPLDANAVIVGRRSFFQIWSAPVWAGAAGQAAAKARRARRGRLPREGTRGMTPRPPPRHAARGAPNPRPARRRHLSRRHLRRRRLCRRDPGRRPPLHPVRHRPRPRRHRPRRRPGRPLPRPAASARRPFRRHADPCWRSRASPRSTAWCSTSASPPSSSTSRSAVSRSASTARLTCAWRRPANPLKIS